MTTNLTKDYFYQLVREQKFVDFEQVDGKMLIPGQAYLFVIRRLNVLNFAKKNIHDQYIYIAGYYQPGPFYDNEREELDIFHAADLSSLIALTDVYHGHVNICEDNLNGLVKCQISYNNTKHNRSVIVDTHSPFPGYLTVYKLSEIPRLKQELPSLFFQEYQERLAEPNMERAKWLGKDFRKAKERFEQSI